jgi:hypothetical protein
MERLLLRFLDHLQALDLFTFKGSEVRNAVKHVV